MMDKIMQIADLDAGTNRYTLWWEGIERSATGATYMQALTKDRLNPLVESINEALTHVGEYRGYLGIQFLPYRFKVRITGEDWIDSFMELTHEALKGRFDIEFNSETLKNAQKELEKQQVIQFLQTISTAGMDPASRRYILNQTKILNKAIDAYDYGPDTIVGQKEYYENYVQEQLAKMRADKEVRTQAQEEGIFPQFQPWWMPGQPWQPGGGQPWMSDRWYPPQGWGKPPFQPGGWQPWGWQFPWQFPPKVFPGAVPEKYSNPEEMERNLEWSNTPKVDLSKILTNMGK